MQNNTLVPVTQKKQTHLIYTPLGCCVIAWRNNVINTLTAVSEITFVFARREHKINLCGEDTSTHLRKMSSSIKKVHNQCPIQVDLWCHKRTKSQDKTTKPWGYKRVVYRMETLLKKCCFKSTLLEGAPLIKSTEIANKLRQQQEPQKDPLRWYTDSIHTLNSNNCQSQKTERDGGE